MKQEEKQKWLKYELGQMETIPNYHVAVLPAKFGERVWVSANEKFFHSGLFYGMDENGKFLVFVDDFIDGDSRELIDHPVQRYFYDWYSKLYTENEVREIKAKLTEKVVYTCADCLHYDACNYHMTEETELGVDACQHFLCSRDFERVVRCKDCVMYTNNIEDENLRDGFCNRIAQFAFDFRNPDDYCSYGKRKDEKDESK